MQNNKDFENVSNHVIDMLLDSTLKKHGVKLETEKVGQKEKEELKTMVESLKKSVDQLSQKTNEKKE
ncbi:hypothetical protein JOC34_002100 [Virgibacillus halotolerans]|uniref:hypothetical protein n=1 Tax=Virgibacillus halotolerans TaxID=1071053 RepID=UPI001960732D|nr:hypothetical protein [Virgibacillus halotolerans]MBM7599732.1 hypothetical protein [Virgibacillus halotolerans]